MDKEKLFACADNYQELAYRTANKKLDKDTELTVACLGLSGEAGEVAEMRKKNLGHGRPLDEEHLKKEVGDVLWYAALICSNRGWSLADIMQGNIEKLMERWPEGFDESKPQAAGE